VFIRDLEDLEAKLLRAEAWGASLLRELCSVAQERLVPWKRIF